MVFVTVNFYQEDVGLRRTTFKTADCGEPFYYNRSFDGTWYTGCPSGGCGENPLRADDGVVFLISGESGEIFFAESNGVSERTFTPVCLYIRDMAKTYAEDNGLIPYEVWKNRLSDCPEYGVYISKTGTTEDWLFREADTLSIKTLEQFSHLGSRYNIVEFKEAHKISGLAYLLYLIEPEDDGGSEVCGYRLLTDGVILLKTDALSEKINELKKRKDELSERERRLSAELRAAERELERTEKEYGRELELFIHGYMRERFGIENRHDANQAFLIFDNTAKFVKVCRIKKDFEYIKDMEAWLKSQGLYGHNASSWYSRTREFYDRDFAGQLQVFGWEFDNAGKVTNCDW